jgi:thiol:disulfide interchange protein DsbD
MKLLLLLTLFLQDNEEHAKLLSAKADREKIASGDVVTLRFEIEIDPGWHIYPARPQKGTLETTFKFEGDVAVAGTIKEPKTKRHSETFPSGEKFEYDYIEESPAIFEVPVRVHGKPGALSIKGKIKGQTCTDVCMDMELDFSVAVTIQADDKPRVKVVSVTPAKAQARNGEAVKVEFVLEIPAGWYIYPFEKKRGVGKASVFELTGASVRGKVDEPSPKPHDDKDPELAYDYHEGTIKVVAPMALKGTKEGEKVEVKGTLIYQICGGPEGVCLNGTTPVGFAMASLGGDQPAEPPKSEGQPDPGDLIGWIILAIGGGLVSLIQPCVFPLLPITMTYFLKQGEGSRGKGMMLGSLYGLGIVVTFTLIGVIFTLTLGADGPRIFAANPWVNLVVAGLFFWFAFSLFGLYEIALPSFITGSLTSGGPKKGYSGAFILGLLFAVVTFTCTIPIAAAILTLTATAGSRGTGFIAMFVYSVTMALPFVLMGVFPSLIKAVQKGGGSWLHVVKVTMGFIELALALYYLSKSDLVWQWGFLTRPVMLAVYVGVLALTVFYLLGLFRMKGDSETPAPVGVGRMMIALAFTVLAVYIASGFTGRSLANIEGILPPATGEWAGGAGKSVKDEGFATYPPALAEAQKSGRPVFLEFTGVT